jgi:hypothetical protein
MVALFRKSGIVTALWLLNAPKGTSLFKRLQSEGRLTDEFSGDNTNLTMIYAQDGQKRVGQGILSLYLQSIRKAIVRTRLNS